MRGAISGSTPGPGANFAIVSSEMTLRISAIKSPTEMM
jgi:hypothetical protein